MGAVAGKVTVADGAWVSDMYSAGAHLRTRPDDAGLKVEGEVPRAGWYFFRVPLADRPAVAIHTESYGTETNIVGAAITCRWDIAPGR